MILPAPLVPVIFFMSATGQFNSLSKSSSIGSLQSSSFVFLDDAYNFSAKSSSLENNPPYLSPRATMIAPVKVAKSIINLGLNFSFIYHNTSASTNLPSASVFKTSIV